MRGSYVGSCDKKYTRGVALRLRKKRVFVVLVTLLLLVTFIFLGVEPVAADEESTEIDDWHDLASINSTDELTASYELTGDLDRNTPGYDTVVGERGFDPIGNSETPFTGTFDGANASIADLSIEGDSENGIGLFGKTDDTVIENVTVTNATVVGKEGVGILVGVNSNSTISGVSVDGDVDGEEGVGGIAGINIGDSHIVDSHSAGTVDGKTAVGGLVGANIEGGTIERTSANTDVGWGNIVGGLVGLNAREDGEATSVIESHATGDVSAGDGGGGLVGANFGGSEVASSYSVATVKGNDRIGGLVGINVEEAVITDSYAAGTVTAASDSERVGGLVGLAEADDDDLEFFEETLGDGLLGGLGNLVGGLLDALLTGLGNLLNTLLTGNNAGLESGEVTNSYWDNESTGQSAGVGGDPLTTTEMQHAFAEQNMTSLDFEETWDVTGEYPALQWEEAGPTVEQRLADTEIQFDGSPTTATATVEDGNGNPIEGHKVLFDVRGETTDLDQPLEATTSDTGDATVVLGYGGDLDAIVGELTVEATANDDSASEVLTVVADDVAVAFDHDDRPAGETASLEVSLLDESGAVLDDDEIDRIALEFDHAVTTDALEAGDVVIDGKPLDPAGSPVTITGVEEAKTSVDFRSVRAGHHEVTVRPQPNADRSPASRAGNLTLTAVDADSLLVTTHPSDTKRGATLRGPPEVAVVDEFGNLVNNVTIDVSLEDRPTDRATVSGTTAVTQENEPARFDNLTVEGGETGAYTLRFEADRGELTNQTDEFTLDETAPTITADPPHDGDEFDPGTETVPLRFEYEDDVSGIDVDSVRLTVDGVDVTNESTTNASTTVYDLNVADGKSYDVTFQVSDNASNRAESALSFSVDSETSSASSGLSPASPSRSVDEPTVDVNPVNATTTVIDIENARAGETITAEPTGQNALVDDGAITIDSVSPTFTESETVTMRVSTPTDVTDGVDDGTVLEYLSITHELEDESFEEASFAFTVETAMVDDRDVDADDVIVLRNEDGEWTQYDPTVVSQDDETVSYAVELPAFSTFAIAIVDEPAPAPGPDVSVVDVDVDRSDVTAGDEVVATVTVENDGDTDTDYDVELTVNGATVANKTVAVGPNATERVNVTTQLSDPGTAVVAAGNGQSHVTVHDDSVVSTTSSRLLVLFIGLVIIASGVWVYVERREDEDSPGLPASEREENPPQLPPGRDDDR